MKNILWIVSLFFLSSCFLGKIKYTSTEVVPPNFPASGSTLLVEELPRKKRANGKIAKLLRKKYKHPFEMVASEEIFNPSGKYADTALYPFAVVHSLGSGSTQASTVIDPTYRERAYTTVDYNVYDRRQKKHYPGTGYPASFAAMPFETLLNTLVKAERKRKK